MQELHASDEDRVEKMVTELARLGSLRIPIVNNSLLMSYYKLNSFMYT